VNPNDRRPKDLLIEHARLIDGFGGAPQEDASLLISVGRIAKIGGQNIDREVDRLDARGLTVLPGLIDSHVHLASVPGSVYRHDSADTMRELRRIHLRAYLACGVTTVLDTGISTDEAREIQGWLVDGHPGPRVLFLSPVFTTPNGYMTEGTPSSGLFLPPVSSPGDVEARFRESEDLNAVGVKVFLESGFGANCWPTHSPEVREAIRREAAKRQLPLYVHCIALADQHAALDMEARTLAHLGPLGSDEILARLRLREHPIYVTSTLSIQDSWITHAEPERLDDPLVQLTVPSLELATARQPEATKLMFRTFATWLSGDTSDAAVDAGASNARKALAAWQVLAKKLHDTGIPIVLGTDSGNWPLMPSEFHGTTTLREMQLLGEAGLPTMTVIRAATQIAAKMLALSDEIGTVEVGKQADLVIVRGNPLEDLRALRNVAWTVKGGIARSPSEWMTFT